MKLIQIHLGVCLSLTIGNILSQWQSVTRWKVSFCSTYHMRLIVLHEKVLSSYRLLCPCCLRCLLNYKY